MQVLYVKRALSEYMVYVDVLSYTDFILRWWSKVRGMILNMKYLQMGAGELSGEWGHT